MTIFLWDGSHYDAPPTAVDGLSGYVHKACEGHRFYTDNEYGAALTAARKLGFPVLGAYFVLHPGTTSDQVDFLFSVLDGQTPWWRDTPAWMLQIDAEKFDYMSRAPSIAEINAFGDEYVRRTGRPASSVFAYAPKWLYGDQVSGLKYALWASNYGSNPAGHYPDIYPGDGSTRWAAYGGKKPLILQYGSKATIAGQTTCDANAFRGTLAELTALLTGDDMTSEVNLYRGRTAPAAVAGKDSGVLMDDVWAQEVLGHSAYDTDKSYRTKQLDQLAKDMAEVKALLAKIAAAPAVTGKVHVEGDLTVGPAA